jgi:L-ascorbate metabolism protein UlaG (beta-lactamase superfamily)
MEAKFLGGNCIKITSKKVSIVIDDTVNTSNKSVATDKDIVVRTYPQTDKPKNHFLIDGPGEYEVSEVSITGIPARLHVDDESVGNNATMYRIVIDDIRIAVVGHIYPDLSDEQIEDLGIIDVLFVPVGGNGFTLDGVGAAKIVRKIEPKIVVPTNYDDGKTSYEVPATDKATALNALGMEVAEPLDSLKIKYADISTMGENPRLVVLSAN